MTAEQLRAAMTRRPFAPFTIYTTDGESLLVLHPEHVAISRSGRTIAVATDDDAHAIIDLSHVTRIDVGLS